MEEGRYGMILWFTEGSPKVCYGVLPNLTRRKLLKRLRKHGITEESLERQYKTKGGYWIDGFIHRDLSLEIRGPRY